MRLSRTQEKLLREFTKYAIYSYDQQVECNTRGVRWSTLQKLVAYGLVEKTLERGDEHRPWGKAPEHWTTRKWELSDKGREYLETLDAVEDEIRTKRAKCKHEWSWVKSLGKTDSGKSLSLYQCQKCRKMSKRYTESFRVYRP